MRKTAKNISFDPRLTQLALLHIAQNRKLRDFSQYVETLVARDLRKKGIRVPQDLPAA